MKQERRALRAAIDRGRHGTRIKLATFPELLVALVRQPLVRELKNQKFVLFSDETPNSGAIVARIVFSFHGTRP